MREVNGYEKLAEVMRSVSVSPCTDATDPISVSLVPSFSKTISPLCISYPSRSDHSSATVLESPTLFPENPAPSSKTSRALSAFEDFEVATRVFLVTRRVGLGAEMFPNPS